MKTKYLTETINITRTQKESEVVLFDCNCHLYEEVVDLIMIAIKCDLVTAVRYTNRPFCARGLKKTLNFFTPKFLYLISFLESSHH
jgi:hypothetical protein